MVILNGSVQNMEIRQLAIWVAAIMITAIGFRYARGVIAFLIEKMYQIFIQQELEY